MVRSNSGANRVRAREPNVTIQRSVFERPYHLKTAFSSGLLYPCYVDYMYPGDTFKMSVSSIIRMPTLIRPVMDNVYVDIHYFAVPLRILWTNFKKFMGEQDNPGDSTDYTIPTLTTPGTGQEGSLSDFLGIPPLSGAQKLIAFPFRAVNRVWNDWYRDENLQDSVYSPVGDGPDDYISYKLLPRGKRKDYFSGALPFAQKGDPVTLSLGTFAPVVSNTEQPKFESLTSGSGTQYGLDLALGDFTSASASTAHFPYVALENVSGSSGQTDALKFGTETGLQTDISNASAITINAWRLAMRQQDFYEIDARFGTRYTESNLGHFGVSTPDARLQRSEYLGRIVSSVQFSPVAQTANVDTNSKLGDLASTGTTFPNSNHVWTYSATEHMIVLGLISARADLTWQQGIHPSWFLSTRFDMYYPSFAHLGEQPIYNREIYAQGTTQDTGIFGYRPIYDRLRFGQTLVTGKMRSNVTGSLDNYHLANNFGNLPVLNEEFVEERPPISRIVANTTEPEFIADLYQLVHSIRPLPLHGRPSYSAHF